GSDHPFLYDLLRMGIMGNGPTFYDLFLSKNIPDIHGNIPFILFFLRDENFIYLHLQYSTLRHFWVNHVAAALIYADQNRNKRE
ncbi:MAG: hypothetical protein AAFP02_15220, partial [Bacteroidota bacterium]